MTILFFVALLLAWPTSGISILIYLALFIGGAALRAKVRMHHADKLRADREIAAGSSRLPSWMASRDKIEEFINGVEHIAMHRGVPKLFSAITLSNGEIQTKFMQYAGAMEAQGASFIEQQMAVAEKLIYLYNKAE